MKKTIYLLVLFISSTLLASSDDGKKNESQEGEVEVNTSKPVTYVVGIVKRGKNWKQDSLRAFELQEKHLKFLQSLIASNKLIASGPLTSSPDVRGLYVFNVKTIKEAKALTSKDEAMNSGWIAMDFHVWASRDYSVPEVIEEKYEGMDLAFITSVSLIAAFSFLIIILTLRTFRGKAEA